MKVHSWVSQSKSTLLRYECDLCFEKNKIRLDKYVTYNGNAAIDKPIGEKKLVIESYELDKFIRNIKKLLFRCLCYGKSHKIVFKTFSNRTWIFSYSDNGIDSYVYIYSVLARISGAMEILRMKSDIPELLIGLNKIKDMIDGN
jgi:hypothetical protein